MKHILIFAIFISFTTAAHAVDLNEEVKVGANADKFIRQYFGVYPDEDIQAYVSRIGHKLLESIEETDFNYKFLVVDDPMLNAFAVPGGYVYITRGMLAHLDSEAALAGVLGHEIGHVIGHHSYKKMKKSLGDTLLIFAGLGASLAAGGGADSSAAWVATTSSLSNLSSAGYGRDLEMQADEVGVIYAYDAGYDPREHSKFFNMLQFKERVSGAGYHGFLASHPETVERIIRTREKADIIINRGKPVKVNRREYLEQIKGLAYGKYDRKQGIHRTPYVIDLYTAEEGDDFRKIAREVSGDESLAFEIAMINSMRQDDRIPAGMLLKVIKPRKSKTVGSLSREGGN